MSESPRISECPFNCDDCPILNSSYEPYVLIEEMAASKTTIKAALSIIRACSHCYHLEVTNSSNYDD